MNSKYWDIFWSDRETSSRVTLNTFQKVNKFEGMSALGNKINLFRELMKMLLNFEKSYYIFPLSWVYPLEDEKI